MIRTYCDKCGVEMPKDHEKRVVRKIDRVTVEILHAVDGVYNGGHVCHVCIVQVVNEGTPTEPIK